MHVIPRYSGDVPKPRGGVRNVIPGKGDYLAWGQRDRRLVHGGTEDPFLPRLLEQIDLAARVDIAVAFVFESGVRRIEEHLRDLLARGGRIRLLTSDYLDATDPVALRRLLDLTLDPSNRGTAEFRFFEASSGRIPFHPKAYVFCGPDLRTAFVGSSNLSHIALAEGIEWNYRITEPDRVDEVLTEFEALFAHPLSRPMTGELVDRYERSRRPFIRGGLPVEPTHPEQPEAPPTPREIQLEALDALRATRETGNDPAVARSCWV